MGRGRNRATGRGKGSRNRATGRGKGRQKEKETELGMGFTTPGACQGLKFTVLLQPLLLRSYPAWLSASHPAEGRLGPTGSSPGTNALKF